MGTGAERTPVEGSPSLSPGQVQESPPVHGDTPRPQADEPQAGKSPLAQETEAALEDRLYIYCVVDASEEKAFGPFGMGGRGDQVQTVCYRDVAAVVSRSPLVKYPISREHTMAHQRVMEMAMKEHTILPVRFDTVATARNGVHARERIRAEVLERRYEELKGLLLKMQAKTELGLKALWIEMDRVFQEIVEENGEIKRLKQHIASGHESPGYGERLTLGERVKQALDAKRAKEEAAILSALKGAYVERRQNKIMGDRMISNCAFLVETGSTEEFDQLVNQLSETYEGRVRLKYVGPVPPCNFVELVIELEAGDAEAS